MAYREPAVRVTQEFTNALPALAAFALPHVNVGPAFQVVNQKQAGSYTDLSLNLNYPEQVSGSYIDTRALDANDLLSYPVKIFLKNTVVEVLTVTGTGSVTTGGTQLSDATLNAFQNVNVGDVIVVSGSANGNDGSYTVRSKISNNVIKTNESFVLTETGLDYVVRRNIQSTAGLVEIPSSTVGVVIATTGVTLPAALTTVVAPFGAVPIVTADVLISYRAQRIEKSADVWEYSKTSELQADFGLDQIVPENPAVFAAYVSLQTAAVKTNLLALNS
jgi:hypothetical protein